MPDIDYFISRTDERLESIEDKIDALNSFRTNTLAESRLTAFIVSGLCGIASAVTCSILTYLIMLKLK